MPSEPGDAPWPHRKTEPTAHHSIAFATAADCEERGDHPMLNLIGADAAPSRNLFVAVAIQAMEEKDSSGQTGEHVDPFCDTCEIDSVRWSWCGGVITHE